MPQDPLFPLPPRPSGPLKLPKTTEASTADLVLSAILGSVGIQPNPENFGSDEALQEYERAAAGGELGGMLAGGLPLLPRLFGGGRKVLKSMPDALKGAGEFWANQMPEVFSKVAYSEMPEGIGGIGRFVDPTEPNIIGSVQMHPVMHDAPRFDQIETMGHELKHAEQALERAIKDGRYYDNTPFTWQYDLESALEGYNRNTFELDAREHGLTGANLDYWTSRSTPDQPTLPNLATPEDIRAWSSGVVRSPGMGIDAASGQWALDPDGLKRVRELRLKGGRITEDPEFEAERKVFLNRRFGSSPLESQQRLPLDTTSPAGPEFTAVGDEPPRVYLSRFGGKDPSMPEQPPYRNPKYTGKRGVPHPQAAMSSAPDMTEFPVFDEMPVPEGTFTVDGTSLASLLGVTPRSSTKIHLRLGTQPAVIIEARPTGAPGRPPHFEVREVPEALMTQLLKRLELAKAGLYKDAQGRMGKIIQRSGRKKE